MFGSLTATGVVAAATSWAAELITPLLIVIGFAVAIILANWVAARFRRRGGKRRRR
jgi:membrane protein implicated in regulation of membrane protease activity